MPALQRLCLLLALGLPSVATAKPSAQERAQELLADGQVGAAADALRAAVKKDDNPDLRCLLGHVLRQAGKDTQAISVLAAVPEQADCHRQATLTRADALRALGRTEEAVDLYETFGAQALGPQRELPIARWLVGLSATARKAEAHNRADKLLSLALDRVATTDKLAELMPWKVVARRALTEELNAGLKTKAVTLLLGQLHAAKSKVEQSRLRTNLAPLLEGTQRIDVLEGIEGEAAELLRIRFLASVDLDSAARRLGSRRGEIAEFIAKVAVAQQRHDLASPILLRLATARVPSAREASRQLAKSQAALGDKGEAIATLRKHLQRFKRDPQRSVIEAEIDTLAMSLASILAHQGQTKAARTAYLQISESSRSGTAARANFAAATLALRMRDWKTAKAGLRDTISRWPRSSAGREAARALAFEYIQREDHEGLKRLTKARTELRGLIRTYKTEPTLSVSAERQAPGKEAIAQVRLRNIKEISAKLHRIDSAAFFGAGLHPDRLADLDVAVVAPDRQWTVAVPNYREHAEIVFDLKISKPKPGLYRLTLGGGSKEASVVLVVSDLDIILEGIGSKLLVVAARNGQPVLGAKIQARVGDKLLFAKTTHRGIAQLNLPQGPVTIWAEHRGSVALASMSQREEADDEPDKLTTMELDRSIYSPGDPVHFAIQGFNGTQPMATAIKVWLVLGGHAQPPLTVKLSRSGFGWGQVRLPDLPQFAQRQFEVHGQLAGQERSKVLATGSVAAPVSVDQRLQGWMHEDKATLRLVDADGRAVHGARIAWSTPDGHPQHATTDTAGRVNIKGPQRSLPWRIEASVIGLKNRSITLIRNPPTWATFKLGGPTTAAANKPLVIDIAGVDGSIEVKVLRYSDNSEVQDQPSPWAAAETEQFTWARPPTSSNSARGPAVLFKRLKATINKGTCKLPLVLPAGQYKVIVSKTTGSAVAAQWTFAVRSDRPWLDGPTSVGLGQAFKGRLRGTKWGLVTIGTERRLIDARVLRQGETVKLKVGSDWPKQVSVSISTADGHHSTQWVAIDSSAKVELKVQEKSGTQHLSITVKNRAGAPIRNAQVLVVARSEEMQSPSELTLVPGVFGPSWRSAHYVAGAKQTAVAVPIASGLLQERALKKERARARQARSGAFAKSKLSSLMAQEALMYSPDQGLGGFGAMGSGAGGGGGRGRGSGGLGSLGRGRLSRGTAQASVRTLGHWVVLETDARGRARTHFMPPARGKWNIVAKASGVAGRGEGQIQIDPALTARLQVDLPGPGAPGERADAVFHVLAGQDGLRGHLEFDGARIALKMSPFETRKIGFEGRSPASQGRVVVTDSEGRTFSQQWRFPLDVDHVAEDGEVVHVAVGANGRPPTTWLAQRPAPTRDTIGLVRRGRAALAALPSASRTEASQLREVAMQARLTLRHLSPPSKTAELAETALFLAEGQKLLKIPSGELNAAYDALPLSDADPKVRAWLLRAWAGAGRKIESGFAERLLTDIDPKDGETRGLTALALIAAHRPKEASRVATGAQGPFAELARARLGKSFERRGLSRAPGASGRAEWIALWAEFPPRSPHTGIVSLSLDGQTMGQLDRKKGGLLSAISRGLPSTKKVPAAMVWRTLSPPKSNGRAMKLKHLPQGTFARNMSGRFKAVNSDVEVGVGDRIVIKGFSTQRVPAGFVLGRDRRTSWLEARVPGQYIVSGLTRGSGAHLSPLASARIQVRASAVAINRYTPPTAVLALAELAAKQDRDPGPVLDTMKWPKHSAGAVATKRFQWAILKGDHETIVSTFDRVRDASPALGLTFDQVSSVARAFRTQNRVERAIDVWRVGLGQAFKSEAAVARRVESTAGALISLQGLRRITQRYPLLPPVEEAMFLAPQRLGALMEGRLPSQIKEAGITATDIRLTAAGWDREYLGLFPKSDRRAEAGFHLVQLLSELGAREESARRASILAKQHASAPLLDGLLLAEGLARASLRQDTRALKLFERVASGKFMTLDGTTAPSKSRGEAQYAAARLLDARGDLKAALAGYKKVSKSYPEAAAAIRALTQVTLAVTEPVVRTTSAQAKIPIRIGNLSKVQIRAYRLDLAVAFLRDTGEIDTASIRVSGVNPAWSREVQVPTARSVRERAVTITIDQPGAWLIQLDGGGRHTATLVIRSGLGLNIRGNRVQLRLHNKPAADAEIRVIDGSDKIVALKTDLRGVAILPRGFQAVLAQAGEHLALRDKGRDTEMDDDSDEGELEFKKSGQGVGRKALKRRLKQQLHMNSSQYEQNFQLNVPNAVGARKL